MNDVQVIRADGSRERAEVAGDPVGHTLVMVKMVRCDDGRMRPLWSNGRMVREEFERETVRYPPGFHGPFESWTTTDPETGSIYMFRFREAA